MTRLRAALGGGRPAALRASLRRLRPSGPRRTLKAVVAGVALVAVMTISAMAILVVIPRVYDEYGFHPEQNARSWAALTPQYADSALCQRCHAREYAPWQAAKHAAVTCESCHGPLAEHAATAPVTAPAGSLAIEKPSDGLCAVCHAAVTGRRLTFPQVDLTKHYAGAPCLGCHDSHATTALRPPDISHSLANLPACVTCHRPAGLKPVPVGHEEGPDAVCRTCHKPSTAGD